MPALMYGELLAGLIFDQLTGGKAGKWFWTRAAVFSALMLVAAVGFFWYAPWVYGTGEDGNCFAGWLVG